jgi:hypothetical protein
MYLKEKIEDHIYYYAEVFENPQEVIDMLEQLEDYPETHAVIKPWQEDNSDRMLKDFRLNELYSLADGPQKDLVNKVIGIMTAGIERVANQYIKDANLDIALNISPLLHVCKYEKGGSIGMHFDSQYNTAFLYTIVVYWNDNYKGGELGFEIHDGSDKKFSIKPEAGSAICFPSGEPFWHASLPLIEGYKYMTGSSIFVEGYDVTNGEHVRKYRVDYQNKLKEMKNFFKD